MDKLELYTFLLKDYPDVLSIYDLCHYFNKCDKTIKKLLLMRTINYKRVGTNYIIPKPYLIEYLMKDESAD